jgi:AraC-like DNA-binding protein
MDRVTISQHDSEAGSWRVARLEPEHSPDPYIGAFYAYDECGTSFRRRRELPDGSSVLVFHLGGKLRVEHPIGARREFHAGQGFYSGASATYAVTETDGAQAGAQIKFSLLGARLFLGLPLEEFGDTLIDVSQALGQPAMELRDRLAETRSLSKKVEILAQAATLKPSSKDGISPGLAFAFRRLLRADVRIAHVAREIGMSRERFSKTFRREFGLSPKAFARVRRFARTLEVGRQEPSLTGAALAAQCGYVDQAHMIHDFREFSGSAPSALWRQELPDAGGFVD